MTDIVSSTSSSHPEQHTDEVKHTSDGATDTSQTDSDGENSNGPLQCGGKDRNPEPPPELLKERILDADNIGGTVFSKHWLFTTLMKLIQAVDSENESKDAKPTSDSGLDLEDGLQDELCNLWDMSMNPEVVSFLQDFKAVDILTGVIAKSQAPRATEICVGILGNMACNEQACKEITAHDRLVELLLLLLESPDVPTLIELTRLLRVCVSMETALNTWTTAIKKSESIFASILFILQSSTNNDLLRNLAEFVDKVMDIDEEVVGLWGTPELVQALLEAIKQVRTQVGGTFDMFLHILQLVSTCETGIHAIVDYAGMLCDITQQYLVTLCSDDVLVVCGRERGIGSAISILCAVFSGWTDRLTLLKSDFQLMRCSLKILEVLTQKQHHSTARYSATHRRRRSRKASTLIPSPTAPRHDEDCPSSTSKEGEQVGEGERKGEGDGEGRGDACARDKEEKERIGEDESREEETGEEGMKEMLREVVRNLLVEMVSVLSQDAQSTDTNPQLDGNRTQNGDVCDTSHRHPIPETLEYLDSMCPHVRLTCLVHSLQSASDHSHNVVTLLTDLAAKYHLDRLWRIVDETIARG
ncbi:hypothetical protein NP493_870g02016 [Ridgeia piscesae]|uniref:Protein saal1 n=1 Tax=Ridgeia piscesae TaxID=27915 RepID=A0AAD9NNE2_RIDPI|nr:hypothetical protein NP493_870g02016 [Ridgeia piscesae]